MKQSISVVSFLLLFGLFPSWLKAEGVEYTEYGSLPSAASLISPSGTLTNFMPTYTWDAVSNATGYDLWVQGPSGNFTIQRGYNALDVCSGKICLVTPNVPLANGDHIWWVQPWNPNGYGPWTWMRFTVSPFKEVPRYYNGYRWVPGYYKSYSLWSPGYWSNDKWNPGYYKYSYSWVPGRWVHVWGSLEKFDREVRGYAMYTYVLFGNKLGGPSEWRDSRISKRYESLLEAIDSKLSSLEEVKGSLKEERNIFYIPVTQPLQPNEKLSLQIYNFSLGKRILNNLGGNADDQKLQDLLTSQAGPFLVSVLQPLRELKKGQVALVVDLSTFNPAVMRELVDAYRLRLNEKKPVAPMTMIEIEYFKSNLLTGLSWFLDFNDNLNFVLITITKAGLS